MSDLPSTTAGQSTQASYSTWFVLITAVFITCLITANIMAVKLVSIGGLILPAAIVIFPKISHLLSAFEMLNTVGIGHFAFRPCPGIFWFDIVRRYSLLTNQPGLV